MDEFIKTFEEKVAIRDRAQKILDSFCSFKDLSIFGMPEYKVGKNVLNTKMSIARNQMIRVDKLVFEKSHYFYQIRVYFTKLKKDGSLSQMSYNSTIQLEKTKWDS